MSTVEPTAGEIPDADDDDGAEEVAAGEDTVAVAVEVAAPVALDVDAGCVAVAAALSVATGVVGVVGG